MDQTSETRNFCIIAHIDHGKSTLADRMIELTNTVSRREMKEQLLDLMPIERERGITIKLQPIRMRWKEHVMNLIDTPGHIDFNYEVSRSLAAVEGAVLLVDATQGVEAQTLANLYLALDQNLTIIPVVNKIDLPAADVAKVRREIMRLLGCEENEILTVSAKTGVGVARLLDEIIRHIPSPKTQETGAMQALIFDAQYNEYKGIIIYVRVFSGTITQGNVIQFLQTKTSADVLEVGYFTPLLTPAQSLTEGSIGYVITNIKEIEKAKVGDTITVSGSNGVALKGYREVTPMVFATIYPAEGTEYEKLRLAIYKLKLNDASLTFTPDHSEVLGFGFRCGFLGLLHLEIFQERLKREFELPVIVTAPTVAYHVYLKSGDTFVLTSPISLPEPYEISHIDQPMVTIDLITPRGYLGPLLDFIKKRQGVFTSTEFLEETRVIVRFKIPLANIIVDFYDRIKNLSSGYASYVYELAGYDTCSLEKLDILIADERIPSLATLVPKEETYSIARSIVSKLKDLIPRAQFMIKIQASVGGKIIAAERISALRKDVTAKLYGGDVTRKRKLLERQKKGKKRLRAHGSIEIPHEAYLAVLRRE